MFWSKATETETILFIKLITAVKYFDKKQNKNKKLWKTQNHTALLAD